ncbi:hypothetical protein NS359_08075 [Curtobacterium oceanosedimentum]|uniref:Uncharacterized protein n=1 Tax=Curtobacterium oceanosedimentum TaxID=465820 RepID=A0A147DR21_9MICO|nr:hypothetical protein NS359_08075 [Curtobacterium oceanosedimentum]
MLNHMIQYDDVLFWLAREEMFGALMVNPLIVTFCTPSRDRLCAQVRSRCIVSAFPEVVNQAAETAPHVMHSEILGVSS